MSPEDQQSAPPAAASLTRREIAARLRAAAELLGLRADDRFRARAYEQAAEALEETAHDLARLTAEGRLSDIRGVGPSLAAVITDLVRSGRSEKLERLQAERPAGLAELARLPGLTERRLRLLHEGLGVASLDDLRGALGSGAALTLPGFGPKTVAALQEAVAGRDRAAELTAGSAGAAQDAGAPTPSDPAAMAIAASVPELSAAAPEPSAGASEPLLLPEGLAWADRLMSYLRDAAPAMEEIALVGSLRRRCETARDINLLAAARSPAGPEAALAALAAHPAVATVIARDGSRCAVRLLAGMAVTLQVVPPDGSAAPW